MWPCGEVQVGEVGGCGLVGGTGRGGEWVWPCGKVQGGEVVGVALWGGTGNSTGYTYFSERGFHLFPNGKCIIMVLQIYSPHCVINQLGNGVMVVVGVMVMVGVMVVVGVMVGY